MPARLLERAMARLTGMYFVRPLDVPEVTARYGIRPGQVALSSRGKSGCQYSAQKSS